MSKLLFMLFFCLVPMSFQSSRYQSCPYPELRHGRVRWRMGTRLARFVCNQNYELVGNKYATCRFGEWDVPIPVCVRAGCDEIEVEHGISIPSHGGAWTTVYCFPGYRLDGSPAVYCDGRRWNETTPKCVSTVGELIHLSCDFESEKICGWRQDELHDFDWSRWNSKTPSAFLFTGPSYDHTLGPGQSGYYMFIESTSKLTNDSARLISPIYDAALTKNGCFSFFYHMYGKSIGGLRVYQIPENFHQVHANLSWNEKKDYLLFEKWGDHGDFWFRNVSKLNNTGDDFQIVIEGIRGNSFTSDIAIDDVAILEGPECDNAISTAVTPPEITAEMEICAGRCDVRGKNPGAPGRCGCSAACVIDDTCCHDFFETCVFNPASASADDYFSTTSSDQPLTEKHRGTETPTTPPTTSTTSTTSQPTTKTTKTTTRTTVRPYTTPRPTRVTTVTTPTKNIPSTTTTTTRKPNIPTTAKTAPTTRRTVSTTRPTTRPVTVRPVSTSRAVSTIRTTIQYNSTAPPTRATRVLQNSTSFYSETAILARKYEAEKTSSSSGATAAILSTLGLAACCVGLALSLRTARGRATLARLRGQASSDPEVRYLTRDDD